jgi:hypothetical protein
MILKNINIKAEKAKHDKYVLIQTDDNQYAWAAYRKVGGNAQVLYHTARTYQSKEFAMMVMLNNGFKLAELKESLC